jgi:hypothetical protein
MGPYKTVEHSQYVEASLFGRIGTAYRTRERPHCFFKLFLTNRSFNFNEITNSPK